MRAADVGIVHQDDVAVLEIAAVRNHTAARLLHHADENRQAELTLSDHIAVLLGIDPVGAVEGLRDHRREGRLLVNQIHLAADLLQPFFDDRKRDGIDGHEEASCGSTVTRMLPRSSTSA